MNNKAIAKRVQNVTVDEFKTLLQAKRIRLATLNDVCGTNHKRPLYIHPNTKHYFVAVP